MSEHGTMRFLKTRLAIDPTAWVAPNAALVGEVTIGAESSLWYGVVARGDMEPIVIGARSNIQDGTIVHVDTDLPTHIGNDVTIGHRAVIHGCTLEDGCLVGMGAVVLSGARVGRGALIAAGTIVRERIAVPPGVLFAGVPGKVLRELTDGEKQRVAENSRSYLEYARRYRAGDLG